MHEQIYILIEILVLQNLWVRTSLPTARIYPQIVLFSYLFFNFIIYPYYDELNNSNSLGSHYYIV